MKRIEYQKFYLVMSIFMLILGYQIMVFMNRNGYLSSGGSTNIEKLSNFFAGSEYRFNSTGVLMIFLNNIKFFLLVSILPFVNFFVVLVQFFNVGIYIFNMRDVSILGQFNILYRHLIFEILALLIAVKLSYYIYGSLKKFIDFDTPINWKRFIKRLVFCYLSIVILTLCGALLEGSFI